GNKHQMSAACGLEHLDRSLDLHQCRNEIRLNGDLVCPQLARPQRRTLTDARVDDDPVDSAEFVGELGKHLRYLLMVVDVQRGDRDGDAGVTLEQFGFELSRRSVRRAHSARSRPFSANTRAIPAPRPDDAPVIRIFCRVIGTAYLSSRDSRRSAKTLPPVWQVGQYW